MYIAFYIYTTAGTYVALIHLVNTQNWVENNHLAVLANISIHWIHLIHIHIYLEHKKSVFFVQAYVYDVRKSEYIDLSRVVFRIYVAPLTRVRLGLDDKGKIYDNFPVDCFFVMPLMNLSNCWHLFVIIYYYCGQNIFPEILCLNVLFCFR